MPGSTLIFLKGPSFGALRGSVRFVANSADETAVGGGHSASRVLGVSHPVTVDMQRSHTEVDKQLALMKEIYARNPRAKTSEGLFRRP